MIDALLYSVRDAILAAPLGYDVITCDVREDGHPPPRCGDVFVAVHQSGSQSVMDNALDEYFSFSLTITMRVTIPLDRVGDKLLAKRLARKVGMNARADTFRFLHMNWAVLQDANNNLVVLNPNADLIYGFCEPARYKGLSEPNLVGPEWFMAEAGDQSVGLVGVLSFADARRLQAMGTYT